MDNSKNKNFNIIALVFWICIITYSLLSYYISTFLLTYNGKTSIGSIYAKEVKGGRNGCYYYFMFYVENRLYSDSSRDVRSLCDVYRIGQKGIVRYDKDNPTLNKMDFSMDPHSERLDSIYKYHILFKTKAEVKQFFTNQ